MNDDFKTKILIEKSKQENKINLLLKYAILLFLVITFIFSFLIFKDNFINFFNKLTFSKKKIEEVEVEKVITEEKNIDKFYIAKEINTEIEISEECKKYNLRENLCEISSLYKIALQQFNEESEKIFSNENIKQIYSDQFNKLLKLKQSSLQKFGNNLFNKAYIDIREAKKISSSIKILSKKAFEKNMVSANEAYLKRDENSSIFFS